MGSEKIDIRDLRDGKFLWIDKAALMLISESTGTMGVAVYSWLCYYANFKAQDCFPSITTLAQHCGVSRRTIMRAIKQLEQLRVILIERKKGKPNIYKLLNIPGPQGYPQASSDIDVTSDKAGTGVVTRVSPAVVTGVSHEQETPEQEISKETGEETAALWITQKRLPYAMPEMKTFKDLEALCKQMLNDINLFRFILLYRAEKCYPPHPEVLLKVCKQFKRSKARIRSAWPWFKAAVEAESRRYFVEHNINEHEALRQEPVSVGNMQREAMQER